jgi:hypothetical protein
MSHQGMPGILIRDDLCFYNGSSWLHFPIAERVVKDRVFCARVVLRTPTHLYASRQNQISVACEREQDNVKIVTNLRRVLSHDQDRRIQVQHIVHLPPLWLLNPTI